MLSTLRAMGFHYQRWADALQTYFGTYRPDLPDWLVYVDSTGNIIQTLFRGQGKDSTNQVLVRSDHVWVVVWSDRPLCPVGGVKTATGALAVADTSDFHFFRRALVPHRDPALSSLIKGMTKVVGVDFGASPVFGDSTQTLTLQRKAADPRDSLYGAAARFGLVENAKVELSLLPVRGKGFVRPLLRCIDPANAERFSELAGKTPAPDKDPARVEGAYAELINASRHRFELAVIAGATWGTRIPTYDANLRISNYAPKWAPNAYLSVVYNLRWCVPSPTLSDPGSFGLFAGVNVLRGNIGDEWVAGVTFGDFKRTVGIAAGMSWTVSPIIDSGHQSTTYVRRLLLGLDFRL